MILCASSLISCILNPDDLHPASHPNICVMKYNYIHVSIVRSCLTNISTHFITRFEHSHWFILTWTIWCAVSSMPAFQTLQTTIKCLVTSVRCDHMIMLPLLGGVWVGGWGGAFWLKNFKNEPAQSKYGSDGLLIKVLLEKICSDTPPFKKLG